MPSVVPGATFPRLVMNGWSRLCVGALMVAGVQAGSAQSLTVRVGQTSAVQTATVTLTTAGTIGAVNVLTLGAANKDYQLASGGTCATGTAYSAGQSCTVNYTFTPSRPGQRPGAVTLTTTGSGAVTLGQTLLSATGQGSMVTYPATTAFATVSGSAVHPAGMAVDGAGDLFIADAGNTVVELVASGGVVSASSTVVSWGSVFDGPYGVAVNGAGDILVSDAYGGKLRMIVAVGGAVTASSPVVTVASGFSYPIGVAVDGAGNVYVTDYLGGTLKEIIAVGGVVQSGSAVVTVQSGLKYPYGVAVDGSGNVYFAEYGNHAVKEIVAANGTVNSGSTVVTLNSSFLGPDGVALDAAGDVLFTDIATSTVQEIVASGGAVSSGSAVVQVAGGFSSTYGLAADGAGNLFVGDYTSTSVKQVALTAVPVLNFAKTGLGDTSTDSPKTVTLQNTGNAAITLSPPAAYTNPTVGADFTLDTTGTNSCPQTLAGGPVTATVAAGVSCVYSLSFTPKSVGTFSEALTLTDDALTSPQTVALNGVSVNNLPSVAAFFAGNTALLPLGMTNTFQLNLTNTDVNNAVAGASAFVMLPAGLVVLDGSLTTGCTATVTYSSQSATVILKNLQMAVGASCQTTFTLRAIATGTYAVSAYSSRAGQSTAAVNSTVYVQSMGATPSFGGVTSVALDGTVGLSVTLSDPSSTVAISGGSAQITLPFGLQAVAGSLTAGCSGATVTYAPGSTYIQISGVSLAAGASCVESFTLKAVATGTQALTAQPTVNNFTGPSGSASLQVTDATNQIRITAPAGTFVGVPFAVTVSALNVSGTVNTGYLGTVSFSSSDSAAALPSAYNFTAADAGTHTFTVTLNTAGSWMVTASDTQRSLNAQATIAVGNRNLVVTTLTDDATGVAADCPSDNTPASANCSLRDAVAAANGWGGAGGTITFAPALTASATSQSLAVYSVKTNGQITVTASVTLTGPVDGSGNSLLTLDGGGLVRVLQFSPANPSNALTMSHLFVQHGADGTTGQGGALYVAGGTVNVSAATLSGNGGANCQGGAVYVAGGTVTLSVVTMSSNGAAGCSGGALYQAGGAVTINNASVVNNTAGTAGGGGGGAFYVGGGSLTLTTSTVAGNSAGQRTGGAFQVTGGAVSLNRTTVSANSATGGTGGGFANTGGTVTLTNSIVAGNSAGTAGDIAGSFTDSGGNVLNNSSPGLGPLGSNGGTMQTMVPQPGSAAVCAASTANNQTLTDQRGAVHSTQYCTSAQADAGAVQTSYGLLFTTQPVSVNVRTVLTPAPVVQFAENGAVYPVSGLTVYLGDTAGRLTTAQSAVTNASGAATFSALSFSDSANNDTLAATTQLTVAPGAQTSLQATSGGFNITVPGLAVTGVSPTSGPTSGNVPVTVFGSGFDASATVRFGATTATNVTVLSATQITATVPARVAGSVDVTVQTSAGTSSINAADQFIYYAPQSYVVTTLTDDATGDPSKCVSNGTLCSLRDAVAAANGAPGVITFSSGLFSGATAAAPAVYTVAGHGPLAVTGNMTITGPVDLAGNSLLAIDGGYAASPGSATTLLSFSPAITTNSLTLSSLIFRNSYAAAGAGGAMTLSGGSVTLSGVTVTGNRSAGSGGGINITGGRVNVLNTTVSGNTALASGGGVLASGGTVVFVGATISGNTADTNAGLGAGFYDTGATFTLTNSTVAGNTGATGAGLYVQVAGSITNSTVSGNTAGYGGGLLASGGYTLLKNSILAGNTATSNYPDVIGSVTDLGGNLYTTGSTTVVPQLTALGSYGGQTQTMVPLAGSPAICAATTSGSNQSFTDQRGAAHGSAYCSSTQLDAGAVQTRYGVLFNTQPQSAVALGYAATPPPAVLVTENGAALSGGAVTVNVTDTAADLVTTPQTAVTVNGIATFSGLQFSSAAASDTLTAAMTVASGYTLTTTSNSFQVNQPFPAITAAFAATPNPLPLYGTTTLTLGMTNTSTATQSGVTVTATLPAGLQAVGGSLSQTCGATVSYSAASQTVTVSGFTLAASASCSVALSVTASATGTQTVQVAAAYGTQTGANVSAAVSVTASATGSVSTSSLDAVAGSGITVTANVRDSHGQPVSGATVTLARSPATTATLSRTSGTTDANGNFTATLTDTVQEQVTVSATASGLATGQLTPALVQFVAPSFLVTVATDPATGQGTASNCTDIYLAAYGGSVTVNSNCSLRDAMAAANALSTAVTAKVAFNIAGTYTTASPAVIVIAQSSPIAITGNVNLQGPGANLLTIEGGVSAGATTNNAIFALSGGGTVQMSGVTLANGYSAGNGAAVLQTGGQLSVSQCRFTGNTANKGGAIASSGTVTVSQSTFSSNSSNYGGALYMTGPLTMTASTLSSNGAYQGGAVYSTAAVTISQSTLVSNNAINYGGGVYTTANGTVSNSVLSGNVGFTGSAALYATGATISGSSDVFYGSSYQGVSLAGNDCGGCSITNRTAADPKLGPLGYYGGGTQVFVPQPGSAAVCAAGTSAVSTDQRGQTITGARYGQSACYDAGAVQTKYSLAFSTDSAATTLSFAMAPSPAVAVFESGGLYTDASETISVTDTAGALATTPQTAATTGGIASFSGLVFSATASGDRLTATLPVASGISLTAQSSAFNVQGAVNSASSSFGAGSIAYGTTTTYTVQTANLQSIAESAVGFTVTLPSGLTVVNGSMTTTCTAGTAVYSTASSTITVTGISLAASAGCSSSFTLTAAAAGTQQVTAIVALAGVTQAATSASLTVTKATPTVIWNPPATLAYGVALLTAAPATSAVAGSFVYKAKTLPTGPTWTIPSIPQPTGLLPSGTYSVYVTLNPSDSSDYNVYTSPTVTLTITGNSLFVGGAGSFGAFYQTGAPLGSLSTNGGVGGAVDASGNVWSVNTGGTGLAMFSNAGALVSTYAPPNQTSGTALAIDGNGMIWVTQGGTANNIFAMTGAGAALSPTGLAQGAGISAPASVSVSASGSLWIANTGSNTVTEIIGVAAPVTTPVVQQVVQGNPGARP